MALNRALAYQLERLTITLSHYHTIDDPASHLAVLPLGSLIQDIIGIPHWRGSVDVCISYASLPIDNIRLSPVCDLLWIQYPPLGGAGAGSVGQEVGEGVGS